jgi:carbon storage regulator CsrA
MKINFSIKPGDKLQIGDNIELTFLEIWEPQARLLLDLPPHTPVFKQENYHLLQVENRRAASTSEKKVKGMAEIFRNF